MAQQQIRIQRSSLTVRKPAAPQDTRTPSGKALPY